MKRSRFETRARLLSPHAHKHIQRELPNRDEYWLEKVKCKDDVREFYKMYYPEFPECLVEALAHYFERGVKGEILLDEAFLR
jgi:hypothetical protein